MSPDQDNNGNNSSISNSTMPRSLWLIGALIGALFGCLVFRENIQSGYPEVGEIVLIALFAIIGASLGFVISKTTIDIKVRYGLIGIVLGAIIGVPASYYFQMGAFRMTVSIVKYISNFPVYFNDRTLKASAIIGIIVFAIIGAIVGVVVARKQASKDV